MQKYLFPLVIVVVFGLGIFFLFHNNSNLPLRGQQKVNLSNANSSAVYSPKPTATLMPFYDLTIPYLKNSSYKSVLGDLTKYQDAPSYTAYLTSYSSDDLKINGLLTIPKGERPINGWPAIVFVHGYIPPEQYKTTEKYIAYVDYLARNGFVVFKIDLRGNGNSQGNADGGYFSSGYVIDTLNAYAALQNANFVNPEKIGLWGHSMGGNIVFRSFVAKPTIPVVVIWAGAVYTYTDLYDFGITDSSYHPLPSSNPQVERQQQLFATYGKPTTDSSFWSQVIPTNYLTDVKGAVEINHAKDDNVVSIKFSQNLDQLLTKSNINHSFYQYPSGGHNISGDSFNQAMQNTVVFFNKYLK